METRPRLYGGAIPSDSHAAVRLPFVEGLRGLAALVVMVGHIVRGGGGYLQRSPTIAEATWFERAVWLAWPGTQMVFLFLIVSGFSLYYSEDRRLDLGKPGTTWRTFLGRRAWRILPIYYLAVALGMGVIAAVPRHHIIGNTVFDPGPTSAGGVLTHLGLVHNVSMDWQHEINGPLWSLAYEAQLYLLFPLLFLAMRRLSPIVVGALAIAFDLWLRTQWPGLWFLGLLRWFALGMVLAAAWRADSLRRIPSWLLVFGGLSALVISLTNELPIRELPLTNFQADACWATAFGLLILAMTRRPESHKNPANWPWMRALGLRSYSLYALHWPLVVGAYAVGGALGVAPGAERTAFVAALSLPVIAVVTEVSYRLIEKPSLRRASAYGVIVVAEEPSQLVPVAIAR
jgi:peptidoglycan/LPS O-acetylase OafA/YrhL